MELAASKKLYEYGDMAESEQRFGVHLELSGAANEMVRRARARNGMKKKELISRALEAFTALPDDVQDLMLKPLDDPRRSRIAAELLRSVAGEPAADQGRMLSKDLDELSVLLAERLAGPIVDAIQKREKSRRGA